MRHMAIFLAAAAALAILPALTPATAEPASSDSAPQGDTPPVTKARHIGHSRNDAPYPLVSANVVLPGRAGLPPNVPSQGNTAEVTNMRYSGRSANEAPYPLVPANVVLPGREGLPPEVSSQGNTAEVAKVWYSGHSANEAPYPLVPANVVLPGNEGLPPGVQGATSARPNSGAASRPANGR